MLTERLVVIGHIKLTDPKFLMQLSLSKYTPQQVYLPLKQDLILLYGISNILLQYLLWICHDVQIVLK